MLKRVLNGVEVDKTILDKRDDGTQKYFFERRDSEQNKYLSFFRKTKAVICKKQMVLLTFFVIHPFLSFFSSVDRRSMHQMILQRKQTLHTIVDCDIVTNKVVKAPDTFFFPSDFDSLRTFWTKKNSTTQQKTYGWDTKKSTKIKNIKKRSMDIICKK